MNSPQNTTTPTTPTAAPTGEILIQRGITFRNSTFGGLKTFIRIHQHRTGERLSNAAAVDVILREYLARNLPREAVGAMLSLSRPESAQHLRELPPDDASEPVEGPTSPQRIRLTLTPRVDSSDAPKVRLINVEVRKERSFINKQESGAV